MEEGPGRILVERSGIDSSEAPEPSMLDPQNTVFSPIKYRVYIIFWSIFLWNTKLKSSHSGIEKLTYPGKGNQKEGEIIKGLFFFSIGINCGGGG
jgi:hypothetical protein